MAATLVSNPPHLPYIPIQGQPREVQFFREGDDPVTIIGKVNSLVDNTFVRQYQGDLMKYEGKKLSEMNLEEQNRFLTELHQVTKVTEDFVGLLYLA